MVNLIAQVTVWGYMHQTMLTYLESSWVVEGFMIHLIAGFVWSAIVSHRLFIMFKLCSEPGNGATFESRVFI